MSDLPKLISKFQAVTIKIPMRFALEFHHIILKFICKVQYLQRDKIINVEEPALPDIEIFYKSVVIKTFSYQFRT